jgi:hypothetical protein
MSTSPMEILAAMASVPGYQAFIPYGVTVEGVEAVAGLKDNLESIGPVAILTDPAAPVPIARLVFADLDAMTPAEKARMWLRLLDTADFSEKVVVVAVYRMLPPETNYARRFASAYNLPIPLLNKIVVLA